jgi:hypothetical protein
LGGFEHFAKHSVGIIAALLGTLGFVIIDPSVGNHLGTPLVMKKHAVLLKEFGAKPVGFFFLSASTCSTKASTCIAEVVNDVFGTN